MVERPATDQARSALPRRRRWRLCTRYEPRCISFYCGCSTAEHSTTCVQVSLREPAKVRPRLALRRCGAEDHSQGRRGENWRRRGHGRSPWTEGPALNVPRPSRDDPSEHTLRLKHVGRRSCLFDSRLATAAQAMHKWLRVCGRFAWYFRGVGVHYTKRSELKHSAQHVMHPIIPAVYTCR
jgi:hypothetical protein